jgi:hypothetical protein
VPRLVRVCALFLAGLAPILCGCGTQTRPPLRFADWFSYDAVRKAAAITVIPAYNRSYQGFNLNGYAKGEVDVIVPVGWAVTVRCLSRTQSRAVRRATPRVEPGTGKFSVMQAGV